MCYNVEGQQYESQGRKLFKELLKQFKVDDYSFTEDEFNEADVHFTLKGKRIIADIKVRNESAKNFPTTLLEIQKCKALKKIQKEEGADISWYVNFFGEDVCYIYRVDNHWQDEIEKMWTWKSHDYSYGKCWKYFFKAPRSKAFIYKRVDGVWVKSNI